MLVRNIKVMMKEEMNNQLGYFIKKETTISIINGANKK